jgi:hypothetical protein
MKTDPRLKPHRLDSDEENRKSTYMGFDIFQTSSRLTLQRSLSIAFHGLGWASSQSITCGVNSGDGAIK